MKEPVWWGDVFHYDCDNGSNHIEVNSLQIEQTDKFHTSTIPPESLDDQLGFTALHLTTFHTDNYYSDITHLPEKLLCKNFSAISLLVLLHQQRDYSELKQLTPNIQGHWYYHPANILEWQLNT